MGFDGGGGYIAITTALPQSSFVYSIINIKWFMEFLYLVFYACLWLRFLDVATNPGPLRPVAVVCRILCSNVRDLVRNLSDLTMVSSQYDMLLCSETLVSDMHHVSELLVPHCLVVSWQDALGSMDGCICTRWLRSITPTQISVWLLRNAGFQGLWCETEPLCVQSLSQP